MTTTRATNWTHPASSPAAFGMHVYGHTPAAHHWRWLDRTLDERVRRLLVIAPRESAKTTWIAGALLAWPIGNHPLSTNFIGSVSDTQATERLKAVKLLVESSDAWREAFPHIQPDFRRGWSEDGLHVRDTRYSTRQWTTLVARYGHVTYPTLTAGGVGSRVVIGKRFTGLVILDDLHDEKNCLTPLQRDRVESWVLQTVEPTVTASGKLLVIGTRWNRDDMPGRLMLNPEWAVDETAAIDRNGQSYWPAVWPIERLLQKKRAIGTAYFRAQYLNDPTGLQGKVFKAEWFKPLPDILPEWKMILLGADLAISESDQADYTAIVTCGLDRDLNLYLLDVVWGHWSMNRILGQLTKAAAKAKALYGRLDQIAIEKVQFQAAVVQEMLRTTKLPARGVVPDKDKVSRARAWAIRAEQGKVYADREARWWPPVLDQLVDFPTGTNDDLVDGVSAAWEGIGARPAPGFVELDF